MSTKPGFHLSDEAVQEYRDAYPAAQRVAGMKLPDDGRPGAPEDAAALLRGAREHSKERVGTLLGF